jgi:phage terminase small subunit
MAEKKLTTKQEMFCKEYLIDLNGTQAAIRAGYSEDSARTEASRLLTNDNIQEYIAKLKSEREEKLEINAQWVLEQAVKVHNMTIEDKDHTNALKSLDLIGKHINIKAFDDKANQQKEPLNINVNFMGGNKKEDKTESTPPSINIKTSYDK